MSNNNGRRERAGFSWRFETSLANMFDDDGISWFYKTNRELGGIFGVSKKTITNWRKNDTFPGVEMCINICEILQISIEWFLTGYGKPDRAVQYSIDQQWLNEMYNLMTTKQKTQALNNMFQGYDNKLKIINDKHQRALKLVANTKDLLKT